MSSKQFLLFCILMQIKTTTCNSSIFKRSVDVRHKRSKEGCERSCKKIHLCYGDHNNPLGTCHCVNCPCFPSESKVTLLRGETVTMSQLQVADKVKAVSKNGRIIFSEVRTLMHKEHMVTILYVSLMTSSNKTIQISSNHLIYGRKSQTEKFNPIYADQVLVGYQLLIPVSNDLSFTEVINISQFKMQGLFAPLTMEGNIVVDGILASCYANYDHHAAHICMTPNEMVS